MTVIDRAAKILTAAFVAFDSSIPPERVTPMSLPALFGTGRLLADSKKALTKTNQPMVTALLKFTAWRKVDGRWEESDSVIVSAIAFEGAVRVLVGYAKNNVAVIGIRAFTAWKERPRLNLTVNGCVAPEAKMIAARAAA